MPLGNLTSQFFANIYLNELDYFVKHNLKARVYIRYVDDFVILNCSRKQLEIWKNQIDQFLKQWLKLEIHPEKSRVIPLSCGIDFVGFRNFFCFRLLRKRSIRKMKRKVSQFANKDIGYSELMHSFQGWNSHAKWADTYLARKKILRQIQKQKNQISKQKSHVSQALNNPNSNS